jgi:hypothetical protein
LACWKPTNGVRKSGVNKEYDLARVPDYRNLDGAHWSRAQGALIDFLNADLDLAFTWLRSAANDVRDDPKGYESTLAKARTALNAIRRIEGRVDDDMARREIGVRVAELETAIRSFRP